jgi:hypothetical protein
MAINTLITIRDAIQAFVDGHKQLERVEFGADDKRAPKITESDLFPMLYVAPLDVEVGRAHNTHRLRIYVYERLNDASQDEWENANDTSLMLRDIRVWWNDYGVDDILIEEDPTGTFKTDGELDKVVGYFAEFRFQIPSHGRCDVPINVTPQPPVSGCLPANYVVEYADGTPIQSGEIPSGQSETIVVPNCEPCEPCENATYILTVGGNAVDSGEIGSGQTEEIPIDAFIPACEDATVQINGEQVATVASGGMVNIAVENESGTPLGTFDEETGVWVVPNCEDATYNLDNTEGSTLFLGSIPSGDNETIIAPDGTANVKNTAGTTVATGLVPSGGSANVTAPDATFSINSTQVATIPSGTSDSIQVRKSSGSDQIGSLQGQHWRIGDSAITLKDTANNTLSTTNVKATESANITAPDGTVENSTGSYSDTVVSGGTLILPDETINIVDEDGNPLDSITFPVYTDPNIDITSYCPAATPPSGRELLKTGQTTSYRTGDDGDLQAGRAVDFFTLDFNNPFGNTNRFTDELGGTTYANNIVIDWSTYNAVTGKVLGYVKNFISLGTKNRDNSVADSLTYSIGTFTSGWRLGNRKEYFNLVNDGVGTNVLNYAPFNYNLNFQAWMSTSRQDGATFLVFINQYGSVGIGIGTSTNLNYIPVRTFTVTGTTLT